MQGSGPGGTNGLFNACPECGMFWANAAEQLKAVARDEPTGEHARRATFRAIAWVLMIAGVALLFAPVPYAIGGGVIVIVAGIATLSFANKQEKGSKRASGIAAD